MYSVIGNVMTCEFEGRAFRKDDKYAIFLDGLHLSFFICCAFLLKLYMRFVARDKASRQMLLSFLSAALPVAMFKG